MTLQRIDRLILELKARYELSAEFVAQVRPTVEKIFSPAIADDVRTTLLEQLAETCQRDLERRRSLVKARQGLSRVMNNLRTLQERLDQLRRQMGDSGEPPISSD